MVLDVLRKAAAGTFGADAQAQGLYGGDICRYTGLRGGTVHPILRRLENKATCDPPLVEGQWQGPAGSGAHRRYYRLTPAGIETATKEAKRLSRPRPRT